MTVTPMPNKIGSTQVTYRPARDILTKTSGFMKTYDFTLNPYSGCSFGCSYCYAAFFSRDQAQQDNWGLWVNAKQNAAQLLGDLKPGALDGKRIYMSSVTDPYQPLEQKILLTQKTWRSWPATIAPSWWCKPAAHWSPGTSRSSRRLSRGEDESRST